MTAAQVALLKDRMLQIRCDLVACCLPEQSKQQIVSGVERSSRMVVQYLCQIFLNQVLTNTRNRRQSLPLPLLLLFPLPCNCVLLQPSNLLPFQACLLPLLRLLCDPRIQNSPSKQHTSTIYAALFQDLDHARCAAMARQLMAALPSTPDTSSTSQNTSSQAAADAPLGDSSSSSSLSNAGPAATAAAAMGGPAAVWAVTEGLQGCWETKGWLDVLEPLVWYLLEVLRRFRQDGAWQQRKEGEKR